MMAVRSTVVFSLMVSLLLMEGCGKVSRKWSEEVALDDGAVITIDRYVKFEESNSLAGDAYSAREIKSTLAFQQGHKETAIWDAPLVPILLYFEVGAKEWVVVATTSDCDAWVELGQPIPPYWEYRLTGGKWVQAKLSPESLGRKTNLFFNYDPSLPARHLSREIKDQVLRRHDFAEEYLHVSAELKTNCL